MLDRADLVQAGSDGAPWYWDHVMSGWAMGLHGVFWLLLIALILVVLVIASRSGFRGSVSSGVDPGLAPGADGSSALAILGARYARGEIDRGEYLERKKDLS
jgi:putative membrane protein